MARVNPQQASEKWQRRLKAAAQDITNGVNGVQEAPGVLAAAKQAKMRAGILDAIDSGKWAERVSSVPLATWKDRTINIGIPRLNAGVDKAAPGMVDFYGQLFDFQSRIQTELSSMPDLTLQDNINRMVHQVQRMAEFKRK